MPTSAAPHSAPVRRYPALLSLLLGAVAALGFAPLQWWPVALVAIALWMRLVHDAPTLRAVLWRGWLFGVGHFTVNDNWIAHAFDFQDAMPHKLGLAAPVLLALYLAVYPMLAAALAWRWRREDGADWAFVLMFAAAWITTEWLRATMFTGYAWDPLGVQWLPTGLAYAAAWVGTYALSGLFVLTSGALVLCFGMHRRVAIVMLAAIGLTGLILGSHLSYAAVPPEHPRHRVSGRPSIDPGFDLTPLDRRSDYPRVRIVQPDIGQDQRGDTDGELMLRSLERLSDRPGPAPRLLLWPEGVVRDFIEDGYPWRYYIAPGELRGFVFHDPRHVRARLARLLGPRDLLLAGGSALQFTPDEEVSTASNTIFAIDHQARIIGRYDKAHLVPYGEYLPMRPLLSAIGLSRLVPGDLDFQPGPGPRTLSLPGFGPVAMQICYEIVFSGEVVDRAHRPRLLFNPSNDAWFGAWGPPQHLAQARMRAIEEGLPILRATPTGISAVIDARGRVLASIPLGKPGAIELPLPAPLPPTLFARLGNVMAALTVVVLLALAVALRRRRA